MSMSAIGNYIYEPKKEVDDAFVGTFTGTNIFYTAYSEEDSLAEKAHRAYLCASTILQESSTPAPVATIARVAASYVTRDDVHKMVRIWERITFPLFTAYNTWMNEHNLDPDQFRPTFIDPTHQKLWSARISLLTKVSAAQPNEYILVTEAEDPQSLTVAAVSSTTSCSQISFKYESV